MDILSDKVLASLSKLQAATVVSKNGYSKVFERTQMACPYGCGRACSGCEACCQITCSNAVAKKRGGRDGGCFITSAVCDSLNKSDDCYELQVFRHFRDTYMMTTKEMQDEVLEYYDIAPKVCRAINGKENSDEIYSEMFKNSLVPAITAIENGNTEKAHEIYKNMVLKLKEKYLGE